MSEMERLILGHLKDHGRTEYMPMWEAIHTLYRRAGVDEPYNAYDTALWDMKERGLIAESTGKWEGEIFYSLVPQKQAKKSPMLF